MTGTEGVGTPTPPLHSFYITFGGRYRYERHPYWGGADPNGWLEVIAPDEDAAVELVWAHIGRAWAFIYPAERFDTTENRKYYKKGRLAIISVAEGPVLYAASHEGPPLRSRFTPSDPQWHGRESSERVCARIEGKLAENSDTDAIENLGYEAEHVHRHCFVEGVALFREVTDVDFRVMASELDWSDRSQYQCAVCGEPII